MDLAKDCLDVALFTDRREVPTFWRDEAGLVLDEILPVRRGHDQYRFDLNGSVLKVNVIERGLPGTGASTITAVVVADAERAGTTSTDPDGTSIRFVAPDGADGVGQIGIRYAVADLSLATEYYWSTLGWDPAGTAGARCGRTMLWFEERPDVVPTPALPVRGWGYITVQIRDCDAEHARVLARGGVDGAPPITLGEVARFAMVRDPDGNWLELSQRASLTGPLPGVTRTPPISPRS
ncbi:MAG: VOC family protein [Ilumatobacteraceae bacterium]